MTELQSTGRALRHRPGRAACPRPGGRALRPPHRPRRRQRDRSRDHGAPLRDGGRDRRADGARGTLGDRALERRRALRRGRHGRRLRSRLRRPCSPPAAGPRCGRGRRTPGERSAPARCIAHAAGADLADLELCQFHPTALALPGSPGRRQADHRGSSRRGGAAAWTPRASSSPTSWPRAIRSRPRSSTGCARTHAPRVARPPRDPAEQVPQRLRRLPGRRARPGGRARSGLPGRALPDRRRRDRPRRPDQPRRACSRSGNAPAPGCTARTGWPRTRSASASSSAPGPHRPPCRAQPRPAMPGAPRVAVRAAHGSDPGSGLGARRAGPGRRGARATARRPVSARALIARVGAGAPRVPGRAPAHATPRARIRPSTASIWSSGQAASIRRERWS